MSPLLTAPLPAELLSNAEALVPLLRERAAETEELRRLPDETISDFEKAGLFSAMLPATLGGSQIDLIEYVDIVRTLSRGDASAGWVGAFLMAHNLLLARYGAQAQADFFQGGTYALAAAAATPPGTAVATEGGYLVSGRWRFASAVMHAQWVMVSAVSPTGPLSVAVPIEDVTVIDTWQVPGMKGTGSNDVEAQDVFVPAHRTIEFALFSADSERAAALHPGYPLAAYPVNRILPVIQAAVALGTADAALELFRTNAGKRVRMQTGQRIVDEPLVRSAYAHAWDLLHVAQLQMKDALEMTAAIYGPERSQEASLENRAVINLGLTGAGTKAFAAVDLVVRSSGASIFRTGDPLERICRDVQVIRNHASADFMTMSAVAGGVLLGQDLGDFPEPLF
ncbi:acyl-CoA dehydrogenase family protein [Arthrobacter zhaoxinii]|uniref:acyl-CoA dehydrogenase family protein n=1 Tax=Arthrobacter zhaoxinii TaxID=2964616 RepID=UPI0021034892|nr:acyl-CoA dehydrogenase family protein [Arthrobacter zhaoxinii]MCQ1999806.1 acyl-CoA dehydrogenase family protein [Arthrobacter zhaoxinii]